MTLGQLPEKAREFGIGVNDRIEVALLPDEDAAAHDRLNTIFGDALARQNSVTSKAQRDDLAATGAIALIFGEDSAFDEEDLVAVNPRLAERSARIDFDRLTRHFVQQGCQV